ncbi:MAG: pyridoxamine 5'-phosphate oxidase family protein [Gemmatimonadetes bacterium]|nr:pyridoxamine 5'-phosphate oxidase family protein [Gemmatimonadota bacterium]
MATATGRSTPAASDGGAPAERGGRRAARVLTDAEVAAVVARNFCAILSTAAAGQPYAVPLVYGFEDGAFYAVLSPGRKVRNIEANPRVCVTILEVKDLGKRWRSVVATGVASWVEGEDAICRALDVIRRQYPGAPTRGSVGAAGLGENRLLRVTVTELAGRGHD